MLIPRFSVRWLLTLTACCAIGAFVVSLGVAGHIWAMALAITLGTATLMAILYAAVFCGVWGAAAAMRRAQRRQLAKSPFAMHRPPPQLVTPENPD